MTSRRNLVRNPFLNTDASHYASAVTGGITVGSSIVAATPVAGVANVWQLKVSGTSATAGQSISALYGDTGDIPITPGQYLTASLYLLGHSAAAGLKVQAVIAWINAAGAELSRTTATAATVATDTWSRQAVVGGVAPASTVRARVVGILSTTATFAANDYLQVGGLLAEVAASAPPLAPLFVPGFTAGAYWDGATESSTSTLYAFNAPTVTTTTDPPNAHIVFDAAALADDVQTVTIYRQFDGQTMTTRQAVDAFAAGGIAIDDPEVPRGTAVSYRAEAFRADGTSVGFTPAASVTIPGEVGFGYISNPLDPATPAIRIEYRATVGTGGKVDAPGQTYRVGLRTVALLGQRGLLKDVDLSFYTDTLTQYQAVRNMVDAANGLLLFRIDPPVALPRLMYVWTKGIMWDEFDQPDGLQDFEWDNVVDQISPIEGAPLSSTIPWQLYIDAFPLWSDFNAHYLTWLDAINNPPEA